MSSYAAGKGRRFRRDSNSWYLGLLSGERGTWALRARDVGASG